MSHQVEKIIGVRKRGSGVEYLVKWKGYSYEDNTWEPVKNLTNAKEAIDEFMRKQSENAKVCYCLQQQQQSIYLNRNVI